ncbi:Endocytosis and vacuole integrity protein [Perkinsus olseni]|uniref:Endocytosis and vacuole integrity protein n=1 Tax=Perkinsus olseni TaxID=32597 RepID=A0A7J6P733_PEROL|nr:Endocytosis and vacuole integrity protein [Perkinsus olseni]
MAPSTSSSSSPSSSPHPSLAVDASCRRSVAHDVEAELRIICLESRKKYSQIKEHSERVIAKLIASDGDVPVEEVLAVIIVASETHNPRLLLPCLGCIQRLIMGQLVNTPKRLTTVVTYLHDRANDTDQTVQVKALQTILLLLTPPFAPLLTNSELLMKQLLSACVILLNSESSLVRHTAVACLRQVADFLLDGADKAYHSLSEKRTSRTWGPLRLLFLFVHDLCLISLGRASRCKWLGELAISRTLALELIESALAVEADVFASLPDFTELAREVVVPTVESTIAVCQYDFKVLIRALRIVYRLCSYPPLCLKLAREICGDSSAPGEQSLHGPSRGLVPLMLRQLLLRHDRPLWARSAVLETFKKILQSDDSSSGFLDTLFLGSSSSSSALSSSPLDDTVAASDDGSSSSPAASTGRDVLIDPKSNRFVELVNSLSHVLHHLWFASVPTQPDTSDGSMRMFGLYDADPSQAATGSDLLALGYCLADSEPPTSVNPSFGAALAAETILLLVEHIKSCDMLACSWAPLLSSLSLLLSVRLPQRHSEGGGETVRHADDEEAFDVFLQSVLNALERLLLGCAKFPQLSSGRDSCLEALAKESLPRKGAQELDSHTATCAKGLLNICHRSGERLSVPGWTLALRTFETLYLRFINPQQQQSGATISDSGLECQVLAVSMDSLFSTPPDADGSFVDMVDALVHRDTCWALERLAMALASADSRRLDLVLDTIVSPALKTSRHPEEAAVCAGKVLMGHINRQGCCPTSLIAPLKSFTTSAPETVVSILKDLMVRSPVATELDAEGWVSLSELIRDLCDVPTTVGASRSSSTGKRSSQLMTNQLHSSVYSTLEALVMDCIDVLPNASVALIIDGLQRLSTNSVINTSLKALGSALERLRCPPEAHVRTTSDGTPAAPAVQPATFDPQESGRLWFDLLTKFQSVSLDPRPSVRHCAIRTMVSMLTAACGCPGVDAPSAVGVICDTLSEVVQASTAPSTVDVPPEDSSGRGSSEGLIVHHSRDSVQKQWNETCVLVLEGSVSVISKYHSSMTPQELDNPTAEILNFIRSHLDGKDGEVHDACANALVELLRLGADEERMESCGLTDGNWSPTLRTRCLAELVKDPQCLAAFRSDDVIVLALLVMATITRPSTYLQSALPFKDVWVPSTLSDTNQQRGRSISVGDGVSAGLHEVASRGRCAQLLWGKAESSPSQEARYRRLPETVKSPVVEARARRDSLTAALAVRAGSTCELIASRLAPSSKVKSAVLMYVTSAALDLMRTYYAGGTGGGQSWKASGLWELAAEMLSTVLDQLNTLGGITDDRAIHYRYCQPPRGVSSPADGKKEDNNKPDWATVSAVAVLIALCRSNFADPTTVVGLTSKLCDAKMRGSGDLGRCALRVLFAVATPHGMLWSPEDARARSIMIADRWVGHRYSGDGRPGAASPASADGQVRDAGKDIGPPLRRLATSELCRRVCCTLSQYAEDEASTSDKPMARPRTDQVLFLLGRLCDAADEQLLLATLPALSKLVANTREEEVRRAASEVMLSLADVLGSKAAYR